MIGTQHLTKSEISYLRILIHQESIKLSERDLNKEAVDKIQFNENIINKLNKLDYDFKY